MKKVLTFAGIAVLAAVLTMAVAGSAANPAAFLDDLDPSVRSAASDAVSQQCNDGTIGVSYSRNGVNAANTAEARRAGLQCQRTNMVSGPGGDPFIGGPATGANVQKYATGAVAASAPSVSLERRWARAQAAVIAVLGGFAIVPGGPSEAFNRIQTCLNGAIQTNQGNLVSGVSLNCGEETIRRAVADLVAAGFYIQFGHLVAYGCDEMLAQATGGSTVESRWAASQAYVSACGPNLNDTVSSSSAELSFAAVAPLAQGGGVTSTSANGALAKAWNTGLGVANSVTIDAAGNPRTSATGNLFQFATRNFGTATAATAIAPLARYFYGPGEIRLSIAKNVSGAKLPLIGSVLLTD